MFGPKSSLAALSVMLGILASAPLTSTPRVNSVGKVSGSGRRYRSTTYVRKTPSTPADFEALDRAQAKRDRKAEKLLRHGL